MSKKFTIKTEPGKPDSLKQAVTIAWTITPIPRNGPAHPFDPAVDVSPGYNLKTFSVNSTETVSASWSSSFYPTVCKVDGNKPKCLHYFQMNTPGYAATLTSPNVWSTPSQNTNVDKASFMVINKSGSTQTLGIARGSYTYPVFHPLQDGGAIVVSSSWQFQAYVLSAPLTGSGYTILRPGDLTRPIFTTPIGCDAFPDNSTWVLCQDDSGTVRLKNEQYSHLGYPPVTPSKPTEKPVEQSQPPGVPDKPGPAETNQLSEVLERLGMVERSIACMQDDYAQGQRTMIDIQNQLTALEKSTATNNEGVQGCRTAISDQRNDFNRNIAVVETQVATLARSFDQSQDRLSLVQKAVADTQQLVAGIEKSTNDRLQDIDRRLPSDESKAESTITSLAHCHDRLSVLEESVSRTQSHVVSVEKAVHQAQDQVSIVQQLVLAKQPASGVPGPVSPLQHPVDLDKRVPEIEAVVEKLERSVQEQRKLVRMMDRRLPQVEGRADKLETELGVVQVLVAGLDRRVGVVEVRLGDDDGAGVGHSPSSSNGGSPVMFPHHLADNPPTS